jgi:3-methyladenine DNA glycosylase AlkD
MNTDLQIQNKKLELIQWLSTIEDLNFLDKISDMISRERKKDWWDELSEEQKAVGAGKTRLDQKYIEKKLNVVATIRNWNTVTTLLEMFS